MGRSLFQQGRSWGGASLQGRLRPELTFSLVLTRGTLPEAKRFGKHYVCSGEPRSMARIFAAGKRGQMAQMPSDVPFSCTQMEVYGALVHIRGSACNGLATPPSSLANALTAWLSQ